MRRPDLEHLIRAAAQIADDDELIVLGSQSILAQFPDAPAELLVSEEADLYPKNHPDRWGLIDGSIGELSPFHETFHYYAQGVGPETAVLPAGWQDRLVLIRNANTRGAAGWCLEVHDLLCAKYVANRDKDRRFARACFAHQLADPSLVAARMADLPLPAERITDLQAAVTADAKTSP